MTIFKPCTKCGHDVILDILFAVAQCAFFTFLGIVIGVLLKS